MVVAEHLVDDAGDQRRVGDDGIPPPRLLEQPPDRVPDQVVRRLVPREREREEDRRDLLVRELLRILVVDLEQRAREVVVAVDRLRRDEPAEVAPVGGHVASVLDLLLGGRPPPPEREPIASPGAQLRPVVARHAHEAEDHRLRQRLRQAGDDVERLRRVDRVEELGGRLPDAGLELRDAASASSAPGGRAKPRGAGGSRLTIDGCGLCPPSNRIRRASGTSGTSGSWAGAAEKEPGSRKTASTSAYRVTT